MGTWYTLVNFTKREQICLGGVSGMKAFEIVANPEGGALTAFYMLKNIGDDISFVPDDTPFRGESFVKLSAFSDVTEKYIAELVADGQFVDMGFDAELQMRRARHRICIEAFNLKPNADATG